MWCASLNTPKGSACAVAGTGTGAGAGAGRRPCSLPCIPLPAGLTQVIRAGQVAYSINLFFGKKENDALALAWAQQFCEDGAVLDRNFALIGPGDSNGGEVGSPAYKFCPLPAQDSCEDGSSAGLQFCLHWARHQRRPSECQEVSAQQA